MSGDYSRKRFDARDNYSGVLMQQGRVQLDADWNEAEDIADRRIRTETVDIFGSQFPPDSVGVAVVSPRTPDAFKISESGADLDIGSGRMYVDGLLAENHGTGVLQFDRVLSELRGTSAHTYLDQPYHPDPTALPDAGPYLVYLDVWQRELTHIEEPDLVEKAVAVDTTTRRQTVWQVRVLGNVGNIDCATPDAQIPGWANITDPSAGRLSSRGVGVDPEDDPCELPPEGGYRGLENQLYRVEIHDGSDSGSATFKWSRDNASVSSGVVEIISDSELKLGSLGRDEVLRFNTGDWVEISDDWRELSGENGDPLLRRGEMRRVTVDDAAQTISFTPALPADLIPSEVGDDTLEIRGLRVRRWDHKGKVYDADGNEHFDLDGGASQGAIPVPAAGQWITLENGVQVSLERDPATGVFRSGDHWVFAARTADASVEQLDRVSPVATHHHYARLAIVDPPNPEHDCRTVWSPDCGGCCTITVAPGEDIQTALDSLPEEGGCVCLKTGLHEVSEPIAIRKSRIVLRGEGPGTVVRSNGLPITVWVDGAEVPVTDIEIDSIRFEAVSDVADGAAIAYLYRCARVRIEHCTFAVVADGVPSFAGIWAERVSELSINANRMHRVIYGIWADDYRERLEITGNLIVGPTADFFGAIDGSQGYYGIQVDGRGNDAVPCRIEDNRIAHFWTAILVGRNAGGTRVANNRITRSKGLTDETPPATIDEFRAYLDGRLYAIDVVAPHTIVEGNAIDLRSAIWGAVNISANNVRASGNTLHSDVQENGPLIPAGIYVRSNPKFGVEANEAFIAANDLKGPQAGIVVSRSVRSRIDGNQVDGAGAGWFGMWIDDAIGSLVRGNEILNAMLSIHLSAGQENRIEANRISGGGGGISALFESELVVTGNHVENCSAAGIGIEAQGGIDIVENRVLNCGFGAAPAIGIGVFSEGLFAFSPNFPVRISGCEVRDTGIAANGDQQTSGAALCIAAGAPECRVTGNRVGYSDGRTLDPAREHRALYLVGPLALNFGTFGGPSISDAMTMPGYSVGGALVTDNYFRSQSASHLVEFGIVPLADAVDLQFEKVTFSGNICEHLDAPLDTPSATIHLWGGTLIVTGNHVRAQPGVHSMSLGNRSRVTLMGNITSGDYIDVGTVTPSPIHNFNVIA